jgi:hypothetical protein
MLHIVKKSTKSLQSNGHTAFLTMANSFFYATELETKNLTTKIYTVCAIFSLTN